MQNKEMKFKIDVILTDEALELLGDLAETDKEAQDIIDLGYITLEYANELNEMASEC